MGHLYTGGMWFKKQSVIATSEGKTTQQMKEKAPDGVDYTRHLTPLNYTNNSIVQGRPININNYFYLPTLPIYSLGTAYIGTIGDYWSCTPAVGLGTPGVASIDFGFRSSSVWVSNLARLNGISYFTANNEDEYRPF